MDTVSRDILQFEVGSRKYNELLGNCLTRKVLQRWPDKDEICVRSGDSRGFEVSSMKSVKWEIADENFNQENFGFHNTSIQKFDSKRDFKIPVRLDGNNGNLIIEIEFFRNQTMRSVIPLKSLWDPKSQISLLNDIALFPQFR